MYATIILVRFSAQKPIAVNITIENVDPILESIRTLNRLNGIKKKYGHSKASKPHSFCLLQNKFVKRQKQT